MIAVLVIVHRVSYCELAAAILKDNTQNSKAQEPGTPNTAWVKRVTAKNSARTVLIEGADYYCATNETGS